MEPPVKRQKRESIDFITRLPDSIIHQILALLPTKYVHRTSVLSKDWHRCVSAYPLPELRIIPVSYEDRVCVRGYYARAERRIRDFYRDTPPSRRRCALQIDFPSKESLLYCNRVLGIVADQNAVQEQAVRVTGCPSAVINTFSGFQRILAADSLAALELSRCKLTLQRLEVKLPNLQKLSLLDCVLSRRDRVLHKFLQGSPSVQHLRIRNCDKIERLVRGFYKIVIPGENLKYFECAVRRCYPQTVTMDIQSKVLRGFRFEYSPPPPSGDATQPPHFRMNIDLTRHESLRELWLKRVTFLRRSNRLPMDVIPGALAAVEKLYLEDCRFQPRNSVPGRTVSSRSLTRLVLFEKTGFNLGVKIDAPNLVSLEYHNSSHPSNPLSHITALNLRDIHIKIRAPIDLSFIASMNDEFKKLTIYHHVDIQCFPLPKNKQPGIVLQQKLFEVDWQSLLEYVVVADVCITSRSC